MLTHLQAPEKIAHFTNYDVKSKDGYDMILNLSVTLNSILLRHFSHISMGMPVCWKPPPPPHSGEKFWVNMVAVSDD